MRNCTSYIVDLIHSVISYRLKRTTTFCPLIKMELLVCSIQRLVLPKFQRLLLLARIALLGIMAHFILAVGRLLGSTQASLLRARDGVGDAACVLVVGAPCRRGGIDVL